MLRQVPPMAAVKRFVQDIYAVLSHVLEDADGDYQMNHPRPTTAAIALRAVPPTIGGPWDLDALGRVVAWCVFITSWNARYRTLSVQELHVRAAAFRLSDALEGARVETLNRRAQ